MQNLFLKAKHWQIFVLLFGLPMVMQIVMTATMFSSLAVEDTQNLLIGYAVMFGIVMVVTLFVFFGWIWSVSVGLQAHLPDGVKMKTTRFKIFFYLPFVCVFLISLFAVLLFNGGINDLVESGLGFVLFGLVYVTLMFCIFYCFYFTAKTYKSVELQEEVKFSDFIGEFFMIWFLFIGIWVLQPKINQLVEEEFSYKDSLI